MSTIAPISLTLVRTLHASPAEVFAAWTDPALMRRWFAPGEVSVEEARTDPHVGGEFYLRMRTADGDNPTVAGSFRDLQADRLLVFTWRWEGSDAETLVTVTLRDLGDQRTELTLTHERFAEADTRDHHEQG